MNHQKTKSTSNVVLNQTQGTTVLTGYEVLRVAQHLRIRPCNVIKRFCEIRPNEETLLPEVRFAHGKEDGSSIFQAASKNITDEDKKAWNDAVSKLTPIFQKLGRKQVMRLRDGTLYDKACCALYCDYKINKGFAEACRVNTEKLIKKLEPFTTYYKLAKEEKEAVDNYFLMFSGVFIGKASYETKNVERMLNYTIEELFDEGRTTEELADGVELSKEWEDRLGYKTSVSNVQKYFNAYLKAYR